MGAGSGPISDKSGHFCLLPPYQEEEHRRDHRRETTHHIREGERRVADRRREQLAGADSVGDVEQAADADHPDYACSENVVEFQLHS